MQKMKELKPMEIKLARKNAELSVAEAARLVYITPRAWHYYERGERRMSPNTYELFLIKTGQQK